VLSAARRLYQRHGSVLTGEKPHRSFGRDLVGQEWILNLRATPAQRGGISPGGRG
jgi:hypothetical protein